MSPRGLDLVSVIMAGGVGTRFWPMSTDERPKQFLQLFDDKSLLQKSFERVSDLIPHERILVLTNAAFVNLVREQLPSIPAENIIGEPCRRDTAAAVCLGALLCRERFGNPVIITLTADHMIGPVDLFQKTLGSAARQAHDSGALYTLGIQPTYPATGYGYLEIGQKVADDEDIEHFHLLRFKEKPDRETARTYFESDRFYWNSGMFVWSTDAILREIENHLPEHLRAIREATRRDRKPDWGEVLKKAFDPLKTVSIDYAVMEKAREVRCVRCSFSWTDVGSWNSMRDFLPRDSAGNYHRGRLISTDSMDNIVFCEEKDDTVMLVGVRDLIVVRSGKNTLVTHKNQAEDVKTLVQKYVVRGRT